MILKIFNLKRGNRDRKGSSLNIDALFMKKEHKQVTKRYGHKEIHYENLLSHAQIPILTSLCNTSFHVHNN